MTRKWLFYTVTLPLAIATIVVCGGAMLLFGALADAGRFGSLGLRRALTRWRDWYGERIP